MKLATNYFTQPNAETESVSISARLTGDFADLWLFLEEKMGKVAKSSQIVRDAIRLLAFAVHQDISGQKICTEYIDDETGQRIKIDDLVEYLRIHVENFPDDSQETQEEEGSYSDRQAMHMTG